MVGLSPSPSPPPPVASSSRHRARSVPLSNPLTVQASKSKRKATQPHRSTLRPPRTPAQSNRFGLRDSDTSATSDDGDDSSSEGGESDEPSAPRRQLSRSGGLEGSINLDSVALKRKVSQRRSLGPEMRSRSSSSVFLMYALLSNPNHLMTWFVLHSDPNRPQRTKDEARQHEEFLEAVRLRQRRDPIQEYEEHARREAWVRLSLRITYLGYLIVVILIWRR